MEASNDKKTVQKKDPHQHLNPEQKKRRLTLIADPTHGNFNPDANIQMSSELLGDTYPFLKKEQFKALLKAIKWLDLSLEDDARTTKQIVFNMNCDGKWTYQVGIPLRHKIYGELEAK